MLYQSCRYVCQSGGADSNRLLSFLKPQIPAPVPPLTKALYIMYYKAVIFWNFCANFHVGMQDSHSAHPRSKANNLACFFYSLFR